MVKEKDDLVVSIQCMVYNHEPYLRQCLDGFVMQKTNFKFEAIVHDDVSTDGSVAIIREYAAKYPDIIKPIYETENQYSKKDGSLDKIMKDACRGKYIAICEGDDYWTDPFKLQKQVNFLDEHQLYSAYATNSKIIDKDGNQIRLFSNKESREIYNMNEIVEKRQFHTASVLWRNRCYRDICPKYHWDTYIWCYLLTKGKIWYDNAITCVYRKAEQGVTSTTPRISWIEVVENWSNILLEQFGGKYLTYTSTYLSLTRDILNLLVLNNTFAVDDKNVLTKKYKQYANWKINIKNIPFILKLFLIKLIKYIK